MASRRLAIIGVSAAVVFSLGYAAAPTSEVVKTETKVIRIKVKEPSSPRTVTKTKEHIPDSCRAAMDGMLSLVSWVGSAGNFGVATDELHKAYAAIYTKDFRAINRSIEKINAAQSKVVEADDDYRQYYPQFTIDLAKCKEETK